MTVQPPDAAPPSTPPREEVPSLPEVVRFLVRYRRWILGAAVAAAVVTLLVVGLVFPPRYRSVATLVVAPATIPGSVRGPELTVQGYERLLASDTVLAETRRRLVDDGTLEPDDELGIGGRLEVRLVVAERTEAALAPTLELVAHASDPDSAAAIANTWATVFLELSRDLLAESIGPADSVIRKDFEEAEATIERLQGELTQLAEGRDREGARLDAIWDRRADEAERSWERRIAARRERTEERLAEHGRESRRILENLAERARIADEDLRSALDEVVRLRSRLAESPEIVVLARIDGSLGAVQRVEELNPLYSELMVRVATVESRLRAALEQSAPGEAAKVEDLLQGLERVQRDRSSRYRALQNDGLTEMASLQRQGVTEVAEIRRRRARAAESQERRSRLSEAALERELRVADELRRQLAPAVEGQRLAASAGGAGYVRLGSGARPAPAPLPRRLLSRAVVAAILGGLLGLVAAVVREIATAPVSRHR